MQPDTTTHGPDPSRRPAVRNHGADADAAGAAVDSSLLWERLGGRDTVLDGALPPAVFLLTNALTGSGDTGRTLAWPAAASVAVGLVVVLVRVAQGRPRRGAVVGMVGVAVAAAFAVRSGDARDYFLPGLWVDASYAGVFALSALAGRPLVGYLYAAVFRLGPAWREQRRLRRAMVWATWGWSGVYLLRAAAQLVLYQADQPELLGLAKLSLGWPVTLAAVVLTLRTARNARVRSLPPMTRLGHDG